MGELLEQSSRMLCVPMMKKGSRPDRRDVRLLRMVERLLAAESERDLGG